jgi:hypothetical protein
MSSTFLSKLYSSRIIWLGDLNYRVAASDLDTWKAVNQGDWDGLLQKDQVCELSEMMLFFILYASGCLQLPYFRSRTLKAYLVLLNC